jgi:hypothetical protein
LTPKVIALKSRPMGRTKFNFEQTVGRFPEGTLERIDAVLNEGEKQSDFIREAVETLLKKREKKGKK